MRTFRFYLTNKARLASRELIRSLETGARTFTKGIEADELKVFTTVIRQIITNMDEFIARAPAGANAAVLRPRRKAPARRKK
jgi:hypothetical protein